MLALIQFIRQVRGQHAMIFALAMRDLRVRYAGTLGGTLWAFAHPLAIVAVFYFVFAVGFRAQGPSNVPFILWFVCGLVPWLFFNDALMAITNSITNNSHLVKKTVFPTEVLPLVHVFSGLIPHAIFMLVLTALLIFFKVHFQVERFLFLYYLICTCVLLLGLGLMLSALQVFYRDIAQALTMILNLWFWSTPIVWSQEILPAEYRGFLAWNPIYYIIEGYRGSLIYSSVVWPDIQQTAYFWVISMLVLFGGSYIFRRLKPEFADVI